MAPDLARRGEVAAGYPAIPVRSCAGQRESRAGVVPAAAAGQPGRRVGAERHPVGDRVLFC